MKITKSQELKVFKKALKDHDFHEGPYTCGLNNGQLTRVVSTWIKPETGQFTHILELRKKLGERKFGPLKDFTVITLEEITLMLEAQSKTLDSWNKHLEECPDCNSETHADNVIPLEPIH